jgi:hypothetical protein
MIGISVGRVEKIVEPFETDTGHGRTVAVRKPQQCDSDRAEHG